MVNDVPEILFRDGVFEHASDAILARLPILIGAHTWPDLHEILVTDYPEFPPSPAYQTDGETVVKGVTGDILISWHPNSYIPRVYRYGPSCP